MKFDLDRLTTIAILTLRQIQNSISTLIAKDPVGSFQIIKTEWNKPLLNIDLIAERFTMLTLFKKFGARAPYIIGEENLSNKTLDLTNKNDLVILLDMVDGTDLLERNLSNWCSAMVFYYPPERRILASFVAPYDDHLIYFAREDENSAYKCSTKGKADILPVSGPSGIISLSLASISFYGQKIEKFLSVARNLCFLSYLEQIKGEETKTRIYNLAGNPMMVKLIDGHKRIDAVFDLKGQAPHDVVPGAFIAQKAGAILRGLNGETVDLPSALLRPASSRISYVLASTPELADELTNVLSANK